MEIEKIIEQLKTKRGGWTRSSLEMLGVPWPPPKGWKRDLIARFQDPPRQTGDAGDAEDPISEDCHK